MTVAPGRYELGSRAKRLGAVYTPVPAARALTRWAVRSAWDRVLDPSCGDGVFLAAARERLAELGARRPEGLGVDIDPEAAGAAGGIRADFFAWARTAPRFDAVIGNPPFVRSHLFDDSSRRAAFEGMARLGLKPSRLMSTWAPFLALCAGLLTERGRLALVLPEELLHVGYAGQLRSFLLERFRRVIVCLPGTDLFPDVQQAVVLLLCDNEPSAGSGLFTIEDASLEAGASGSPCPADPQAWLPKWTHLFLSAKERALVAAAAETIPWKPLADYGRVEVGVVTGDNAYFLLAETQARRLGPRFVTPVVARARDLEGIAFTAEDFRKRVAAGGRCRLLTLDGRSTRLPRPLRAYLAAGEGSVSARFKCRTREPWYAVPGVWASDALMLRQAGAMPRLVHLAKRCTATDTIHRVRWRRPSLGRRHVVGFLNSWTLVAAELTGRSYGGGVLELMPSEANRLPLPPPEPALDPIFEPVDGDVRERRLWDAVRRVDEAVLSRALGREAASLTPVLEKLVKRRTSRRAGRSSSGRRGGAARGEVA